GGLHGMGRLWDLHKLPDGFTSPLPNHTKPPNSLASSRCQPGCILGACQVFEHGAFMLRTPMDDRLLLQPALRAVRFAAVVPASCLHSAVCTAMTMRQGDCERRISSPCTQGTPPYRVAAAFFA